MKYVALYLLILNTYPNFSTSIAKEYHAFIGFDNLIEFNQKKYSIQIEKRFSESIQIKTNNSKIYIHPLESVGMHEVKLYLMSKSKKVDSILLKLEYAENGNIQLGEFETIYNREDLLKKPYLVYYNPYRKMGSNIFQVNYFEMICIYKKKPIEQYIKTFTPNFSENLEYNEQLKDLKDLHFINIQLVSNLNHLKKDASTLNVNFHEQKMPYPLYNYTESGYVYYHNQLNSFSVDSIQFQKSFIGIKDSLCMVYAQHADSTTKTPLYKRYYKMGQMTKEFKYDLNTLAIRQEKIRINDSMQQITIFHNDGSKAFEGIAILNTPNREYRLDKQVPVELSTSKLRELYNNIPLEYQPLGQWKAFDNQGNLLLSVEFKTGIDSSAMKNKSIVMREDKNKLRVVLNPIPYLIYPSGECIQYNSEGQLMMRHLFDN
jgi:hypothetical protein